jgi:hypothetical protein
MISSGMPRVNITELSQDQRVPSFPGVYGYLQLPGAPIGPLEETLISSDTELLQLFTTNGKIGVGYDESYWDAIAFLKQSNTLWAKRVVKNALFGGVAVKERTASGSSYPFPTGESDPTAFSFAAQDSFILYQANPGTWANNPNGAFPIAVRLYAYDTEPSKVKLPNAFMIEVYNANNLNIPLEPAWLVSKTEGAKDGFGHNIYLPDVLKGSQYIRAFDDISTEDSVYPKTTDGSIWSVAIAIAGSGYSINDILTLTGGDSNGTLRVTQVGAGGSVTRVTILTRGLEFTSGTSYPTSVAPSGGAGCQITVTAVGLFFAAGTDGAQVTSVEMIDALTKVQNPDNLTVTILMDGGWAHAEYASALWTIAAARHDSVAILSVDPAAELAADYITQIKAYRDATLAANTSYAALYTPHVLIYDKYNDRPLYVPPDGYAAAALSANASNTEFWFTAAGDKRGVLNVQGLARIFTDAEIGDLYDDQINPIRFTPSRGIRIWGQKTLLPIPEDLQSLNVRCLLIVIEPAIKSYLEGFLFDLNTPAMRNDVQNTINAYMNDIKSRTGVTDFYCVCNGTNNSNTDEQNHVMNVDLYIQPTLDVEYINFQMIITRAGITFQTAG